MVGLNLVSMTRCSFVLVNIFGYDVRIGDTIDYLSAIHGVRDYWWNEVETIEYDSTGRIIFNGDIAFKPDDIVRVKLDFTFR